MFVVELIILLAIIVQLFFWLYAASRIVTWRPHKNNSRLPHPTSVSVIICAKNESVNLQQFLPIVLDQQYDGPWELIVVNDRSTDNTAQVLEYFCQRSPRLKVVTLDAATPKKYLGKRNALAAGVEVAKHEAILLTDADCYPLSQFWIKGMANELTADIDLVLGFSPYQKKPGFLNWFIRLEAIWTAIQYFGFALSGYTYMGVGRNLMYRRTVFLKNLHVFAQAKSTSGDDDFMAAEVAKSQRVACSLTETTYCESVPKLFWHEYMSQKTRHNAAGIRYSLNFKALLGVLIASQIITTVALLLGIFFLIIQYNAVSEIAWLLLVFRYIVTLFILSLSPINFINKKLLATYIGFETSMSLTYLFFSVNIIRRTHKSGTWK